MSRKKKTPNIAPGIDDDMELDKEANAAEVAKGESTKVTTLSFYEVKPSE